MHRGEFLKTGLPNPNILLEGRPRHNSSSLDTPPNSLRRPISQVSFITAPNNTPSAIRRSSMNELAHHRNSMLAQPTQSSASAFSTPHPTQPVRTLERFCSFVRSPPTGDAQSQTSVINNSNIPQRTRYSSLDAGTPLLTAVSPQISLGYFQSHECCNSRNSQLFSSQ